MVTPASESVRSNATLQPQGTDRGQNTSFLSLASSPATFLLPLNSSISNASSCDPTSEQAQAIAILRKYHDSDIVAWHKLSQSTEPSWRHRDRPGGLSNKEILAISALRACPFESLIQWLEASNQISSPSSGLSASRFGAVASSRQTRPSLPRTADTSGHPLLITSTKASPQHLSSNPYSALTAAQNHVDFHPRVTTYGTPTSVQSANSDYIYWCTICDNHSYKLSDGWKKHEKEHEIKYVCMLKGPFEPTYDGRKCVLCGALNEADSHLLVHNVASCVEPASKRSFKRRYGMVGHLKDIHDIQDTTNGRIIADKWQYKSSKKAWSCGFCIRLFSSLQDRLRHIGTEHFERGQSIKDWNYSNVIQGLLLQPGINQAWQRLLESLDPFRPSETKWNKPGSESLLRKLEKGLTCKETPQSLARAAYDSAEFDWSPSGEDTTTSASPTKIVPNQYTNRSLVPPSQSHVFTRGEASVQYQSWSLSPYQVSQNLSSSPFPQIQTAYGTAASNSSPTRLPTFDQSAEWDPLTSDTGDQNSTQPSTPSNDQKCFPADPSVYNPWSGYSITPDPAHSDQETLHYNTNDKADWRTHHQLDIDPQNTDYTLKHPRGSASPLAYENSQEDRPRKKVYRKSSGRSETMSCGLNIHYGQRKMDDNDDIRSEIRARGLLNDGLYK